MSNILEVNNNALSEATFKLKIIDGSKASPYVNGIENSDLMQGDYWITFLNNADYIEVPIKKIESAYKCNSIWFFNNSINDYVSVEVADDVNNNIMDFINNGAINDDVPFTSIAQLIFIIEVEFINDTGFIDTQRFFVGRPEISENSTSKLSFKIESLDSILSTKNSQTDFETTVLQKSNASFYNFITLKQAFARIINDPHHDNDNYANPICPFVVNEENYLPEGDQQAIYDTFIVPDEYDIYAEDYITGATLGFDDINYRKQVFYYKDSPECGIVDIWLDGVGNVTQTEDFSMSSIKFFTNEKQSTFNESSNAIYENIHRCFRPVKSFIAPEQNTKMFTAWLSNDAQLVLGGATSPQTRIDENDEILIVEQLAEPLILARESETEDRTTIDKIIMFQNTSNVYYYNRTKNVFYWNCIAPQVKSTPFPKQFLYLRDSGYFNAPLVFNSFYDTGHDFYNYDTFTRVPFEVRHNYGNPSISPLISQLMMSYSWLNLQLARTSAYETTYKLSVTTARSEIEDEIFSTGRFGYIGIYLNDSEEVERVQLEPNGGSDYRIEEQLDILHKFNPKSIKFSDDYELLCLYQVIFFDSNHDGTLSIDTLNSAYQYTTQIHYSFSDPYKPSYEHRYSSPFGSPKSRGYTYDFNVTPYNNNLTMCTCRFVRESAEDPYDFKVEKFFPNIKVLNTYTSSENYRIANGFTSKTSFYPTVYSIYEDFVTSYDGDTIEFAQSVPYSKILDVNPDIDRMIYLDVNNNLTYAVYSTGEFLFKDTYSSLNDYLLSCDRDLFNFVNTATIDNFFKTLEKYKDVPVRLLSYEGDRYSAVYGLANSFFKNCSNDNNGIKRIGYNNYNYIALTDSEIAEINIKEYDYTKLQYEKYSRKKNDFKALDNETANSKTEDDNDFDFNTTVNMYSKPDFNGSIFLTRDETGIDAVISNNFGTSDTIRVTPTDYADFSIDLTSTIFTGTIFCNFYDTEIEVGGSFSGEIERQKLVKNSVKDEVVATNAETSIWQKSETLNLKFPFLHAKYAPFFNEKITSYFMGENGKLRKILMGTITINQLLLFDENYNILNAHENLLIVNSKKPLNGYYLHGDEPTKLYGNNTASFYIEKITYNFNNRTTTFNVVGV